MRTELSLNAVGSRHRWLSGMSGLWMRQIDCSTLWDPQQKMLDGRMWSVCNVGPKCVLLLWHDSADWDDMVQQIVRCTAVQTPMNSDKFIHQQVINKTKQIHSATKTTQFAVRNSGHLQRNPACGVESNNRVILLIWRVLHLWEQTSKAKGVHDTW